MRKTLAGLILLLFCQQTFAESCPSVKEIKKNELKNWKAYDTDNNEPISITRLNQFKQNAAQFVLAEWDKGSIHCYYHDKYGSDLAVYLAKHNFQPENSKHFWYQVTGAMHCAAGMHECAFNSTTLVTAKK